MVPRVGVNAAPGLKSATVLGESFARQVSHRSSEKSRVNAVQSNPELDEFRASIDNLDDAIMCMLAERFKITKKVGILKSEQGLAPADPQREAQQISRLRELAKQSGLDPEFAQKWLNFVLAEVVRHHEAVAREQS